MTSEATFLQAIYDAPADDAPRLAWADWLESQGQAERAEFIRLQIRLAPLRAYDPEREAPAAREQQLYYQHRDEWAAPLRRLGCTPWFKRGLVASAQISATKFLKNAERLFQFAPLLGELYLDHTAKYVDALAASPYLARLTSLTIVATYQGASARLLTAGTPLAQALAASPHLANLRHLELSSARIGDEGLAALAGSRAFAHLESLGLEDNQIGPAGLAPLVESPHLGGLWGLWLHQNPLGDEAVAALVASPHLTRLRELGLADTQIGDEAVLALAASPHLAALEILNLQGKPSPLSRLRGNCVTGAGLAALANAHSLSALRILHLRGNQITGAGLAGPLRSARLPGLRDLNLMQNPLGDEGALALADASFLAQLTKLDLFDTRLTDAGAGPLVRAKGLSNLQSLCLAANYKIGDAIAEALAARTDLKRLKSLDLSQTQVGYQGMKALLHSPHLPELKELRLVFVGLDSETEKNDPKFAELVASVASHDAAEVRTALTWGYETTSYVRLGKAGEHPPGRT
jgi:uncharacterized protein (TIGR02996 family)